MGHGRHSVQRDYPVQRYGGTKGQRKFGGVPRVSDVVGVQDLGM